MFISKAIELFVYFAWFKYLIFKNIYENEHFVLKSIFYHNLQKITTFLVYKRNLWEIIDFQKEKWRIFKI